MRNYDVIVIGGGHAGAEAAWAAAQLGARTSLVTFHRDAIGRMSCNPAIGGLGKGQMVREIDALGGIMGVATDRSGIQFRMLNRSKGPAVWAPRAQCDRDLYPKVLQEILATAKNLEILEGSVESIDATERAKGLRATAVSAVGMSTALQDGATGGFPTSGFAATRPCLRVTGVTLKDGRRLSAVAVVITTGTFLRGLMHCGETQNEGGRIGEPAATGLSGVLESLGFQLGRLKTGTPPRIHRDTIDYDRCEIQPGDDVPMPFSAMTDALPRMQLPCWVTWTNESVHDSIRANLHRAPMYSGQIASRGPRYCPSIEDKVVRFADKSKHQVFLEPEGYDNERIYCNGISTSLPADVQDVIVREIPGLESARILQHGYAVEYDFVPTHQTHSSLETKLVAGLFLAGQINGTSGYEEAAAQGIVAGINAARSLSGGLWEPFVPGRDEAYIGVMLDDLVTRPPTEPYRMFTSRAEYRLRLRSDNADDRLTPVGRRLGLVDDKRWIRFEARRNERARVERRARATALNGQSVYDWMRRPEARIETLADSIYLAPDGPFCVDALEQSLIEAKYTGYVERQDRQVERFRRLESLVIPPGTDFSAMAELRHEAKENFIRVAPRTLGQAGRISGISPADITVLWIYLTGRRATAAPPRTP